MVHAYPRVGSDDPTASVTRHSHGLSGGGGGYVDRGRPRRVQRLPHAWSHVPVAPPSSRVERWLVSGRGTRIPTCGSVDPGAAVEEAAFTRGWGRRWLRRPWTTTTSTEAAARVATRPGSPTKQPCRAVARERSWYTHTHVWVSRPERLRDAPFARPPSPCPSSVTAFVYLSTK